MARPSIVDRLPLETRMVIKQMRAAGGTIDEIATKLRELGVDLSRSALGRHVKRMGEICPIGVAQELEAVRGSVDRLSANVAELRRELGELGAGDIALLRGAVRQLHEELRDVLSLRGLRAG